MSGYGQADFDKIAKEMPELQALDQPRPPNLAATIALSLGLIAAGGGGVLSLGFGTGRPVLMGLVAGLTFILMGGVIERKSH